jgi:trehalose-phosphatase
MNLVAKEFVAARDDLDGVLILSELAGASEELAEALLINPTTSVASPRPSRAPSRCRRGSAGVACRHYAGAWRDAMCSRGHRTSSTDWSGGEARASSMGNRGRAGGSAYAPSEMVAADVERRTHGRHLLLLTDFDGTLAEFAPTPSEAVVSAEVRRQISAVKLLPSVTFGVVSGRRLVDVRRRVGPLAEFVAGLHGLEIDGPQSTLHHHALDATAPIIASLFSAAERTLVWCPGVFLENKTYALTCHVRLVAPDLSDRALEQFRALAAPELQAHVIKIMAGAKALELLPYVDWHKGRAAEWIRTMVAMHVTEKVSIVYLGDDRTDEDAFAALDDDDVAIGVGDRPAAHLIDWRLAGPPSVGRFLNHLAECRRRSTSS